MCGIAGFSLVKCDAVKVDSRALAGCLLINIEHRGRHATGMAWTETTPEGLLWYYAKAPLPARKFGDEIRLMPRHSRRALLHVRYATTGSPDVNENNHPIVVPSGSGGSVIGTHNGIVNNHEALMKKMGAEYIGEVDSQALFHLVGQADFKPEMLREVHGSAAFAYVDNANPTEIKLVRTVLRPLWLAQTANGSTLWASEEEALLDAMKMVKLEADFVMEVPEWTTITINDGVLTEVLQIPASTRNQPQHRGLTLFAST